MIYNIFWKKIIIYCLLQLIKVRRKNSKEVKEQTNRKIVLSSSLECPAAVAAGESN